MSTTRSRGMSLPRIHERQRGAVAIIVGLMIVVLVGFIGLALDLGKLYVSKSELQNRADSCALAAARDLTGATPLTVSEAAGLTAAARNLVLFQGNLEQQPNITSAESVTYSDSLANPFLDKNSVTYALNTIKYVKCDVSRGNIANWFAQVLNAIPGIHIGANTVGAFAVATTTSAQTTCAIPVYICRPDTATPAVPGGYTIGQWLTAKIGTSGGGVYGGGNFGWADLSGGKGNTPALDTQLQGAGQCNLPALNTQIGTTGNKASLSDAWNSRFGITTNKTTGVTDFTGFAYTSTTWTAQSNAYNGTSTDSKGASQPNFLAARKTYQPYQSDSVTGLSTKGSAASQATYQAGADRRLVLAPIVDCSTFSTPGTHQANVTGWACVLMVDPMQQGGNIDTVHLEYRGDSSLPGSPCATQGMPGASTGVGPLVPVLVQ
ncbi:pilus assembly protein TadG-related protein [Cupriavidus metallidurans]|uniref:pilus assembly protein TadG-related protein n=2 Tax=Cupriavidus metallidurans TaxID=119219 RepID=UPI001F2C63FF|nr:TadE/TadG family type IV pilus assembly protein [Cupriavidus metallidurans]